MSEFYINSLHRAVLKKLSEKRLASLKDPYLKLVILNTLPGQTFARIKKIAVSEKTTKEDLQNMLIGYFDKYEIPYEIKEQKIYPDRTVSKRVSKFHKKKRKEGYKSICGFLSGSDYVKFQKLKQKKGFNNSQVLSYLLNSKDYTEYDFIND
jgi:hypothetical protein